MRQGTEVFGPRLAVCEVRTSDSERNMQYKFLALGVLVVLMMFGSGPAFPQQKDSKLIRIVSSYDELTKDDARQILNAQDTVAASQAAKSFTQKTDAVFADLSTERLVNPKITVYQADWVKLKSALEADPTDYATKRNVTAFKAAFIDAARGGKCTANVITGTRGATVRYAKHVDERMGIADIEAAGLTPTRIELERAVYTFKVFRQQRQTGKREAIPCLRTDAIVDIDISE